MGNREQGIDYVSQSKVKKFTSLLINEITNSNKFTFITFTSFQNTTSVLYSLFSMLYSYDYVEPLRFKVLRPAISSLDKLDKVDNNLSNE